MVRLGHSFSSVRFFSARSNIFVHLFAYISEANRLRTFSNINTLLWIAIGIREKKENRTLKATRNGNKFLFKRTSVGFMLG